MIRSILLFLFAGILEICGGYLVWLWLREDRSFWLGILGFILLSSYGVIPVFQSPEHPFGRIYAAYGAIFIILACFWGWKIDQHIPDLKDAIGMVLCLIGAIIMMLPRHTVLTSP